MIFFPAKTKPHKIGSHSVYRSSLRIDRKKLLLFKLRQKLFKLFRIINKLIILFSRLYARKVLDRPALCLIEQPPLTFLCFWLALGRFSPTQPKLRQKTSKPKLRKYLTKLFFISFANRKTLFINIDIHLPVNGHKLFAQRDQLLRRAKTIAPLTLDLICTGEQVRNIPILLYPRKRRLRPDIRHTRNIVSRIPLKRKHLQKLVRPNLHILHQLIKPGNLIFLDIISKGMLIDKLQHILILRADKNIHPLLGSLSRKRTDDVISFEPVHPNNRNIHRRKDPLDMSDLNRHILRHRLTMGFVFRVDFLTKTGPHAIHRNNKHIRLHTIDKPKQHISKNIAGLSRLTRRTNQGPHRSIISRINMSMPINYIKCLRFCSHKRIIPHKPQSVKLFFQKPRGGNSLNTF